MAAGDLIGALFAIGFGGFFIIGMLWGVLEIFGRIYGTYKCLVRKDLSSEQRIIYLLLIWFIPLGWAIYFLLGTERTQQLFSDVDFS